MKNIILTLFLLSFQISFAQSGWFWQNPTPSGSNLNCAAYLDANTILAASDDGVFLKSTDSGITWKSEKVLPPSMNYSIRSKAIKAFSLNKINVLIIKKDFSSNKYIYQILKTVNGGTNWITYTIDTLSNWNMDKLQFVNENTGYAYTTYRQYTGITKSLVYKTTNAGLNWSKLSIGTNDTLSNVCFINENTGWICGGYFTNKFFKTTNAGASWQTYYADNAFNIPCFANENTGYIFKDFTGSKTTNGGINFVSMTAIAYWEEEITDAGFLNENTGWAMTSVSIYMTSNGGQYWFKTYSAPIAGQSNFYNIINNGSKACVVGNIGLISTSTNFGFNWTQRFSNIFPNAYYMLDVFFLDANTGWIKTQGIPSKSFKTVDGGNNWTPLDSIWGKIRFVNQNTGIVLKGNFARTSDGGATWQNYSYPGFIFSKASLPSQNIFYLTGNDNTHRNCMILKSTNSGINWAITAFSQPRIINDIQFINETTGFLTTDSSGIFRTTDGSATWQYIGSVSNTFSGMLIYFTDVNTGFVSSYTEIYKTTNGGVNWQQKFAPPSDVIYSMQFVNNLTGWAGGLSDASGRIYKTTDGGNSWVNDLPFSLFNAISSVYFLNESTGWAVGSNGILLKTTTGGTSFIEPIGNNIPDKFYLSQNYPNPFNPNTNIEFSLPQKSFVKLKVFDLLGREVANLVNENLSEGSYKYDFNASLLPSGIYFYKLEAENFSETRKMVLVK